MEGYGDTEQDVAAETGGVPGSLRQSIVRRRPPGDRDTGTALEPTAPHPSAHRGDDAAPHCSLIGCCFCPSR